MQSSSGCRSTKERMDGESEGLRRQVARLELTIQAEMEKGKVLQVTFLLSISLAASKLYCVLCAALQALLTLAQNI